MTTVNDRAAPRVTTIALDEDVLARVLEARLLRALGALRSLRLVVPEQVNVALSLPLQRQAVSRAITTGIVTLATSEELAAVALYAAMRPRMSSGQAACLAMAQTRGMSLATDDRTALYREAVVRLGAPRVLTTLDLLAKAVAEGALTEAQVTKARAHLGLHEPRVVVVTTESRIVYRPGDDDAARTHVTKTG